MVGLKGSLVWQLVSFGWRKKERKDTRRKVGTFHRTFEGGLQRKRERRLGEEECKREKDFGEGGESLDKHKTIT